MHYLSNTAMMGTRGQKGGQAGDVCGSPERSGFAGRMNGAQGRNQLRRGRCSSSPTTYPIVIIISTIVISPKDKINSISQLVYKAPTIDVTL